MDQSTGRGLERRFKVLKRAGRKHLRVRWFDGERWREKSSGVTRRRDAERIALQLIEDASAPASDDWLDFRQTFEKLHLCDQSSSYRSAFLSATRKLEELCSPRKVSDVTPLMLVKFRVKVREQGLSIATAACYLKHLRAALNWGRRHCYLTKAVLVEVPRKPGGDEMKGRPLTGEEFDRLLDAADLVLGEHAAPLKDLMRCYWLSGLRRGEGMLLSWDNPEELLLTNIDGRRPMVEIPAELDKARKRRLLPLTPDFVAFLRSLPGRSGRVFRPLSAQGTELQSADAVGRLVSEIGKRSNIITQPGRHPTAHDLRRSFGSRWALRVTPVVLKELMRHADIKTTLTYYVGQSAERTANEVWEAFGRNPGDALGDSLGDTQGGASQAKSP